MRTRRLATSLLMSATMMLSLVAVAPGASAQVVTATTRSEPTAQVIAKWRDWCYTYESGWQQCPASTLTANIWP